MQRKSPISTYFSIQFLRFNWLIGALLFSNLFLVSTAWSQSKFEPPFWPAFPKNLSVVPTHVTFQAKASAINQAADPFQSDLKVIGEGRGFLVLASSVDHVVFATVPRMELAWRVACTKQDCEISQATGTLATGELVTGELATRELATGETEPLNNQVPAYRAAVQFANSRGEKPAIKKATKPTLPPISVLMGSRKRGVKAKIKPMQSQTMDTGGSLLQGFK